MSENKKIPQFEVDTFEELAELVDDNVLSDKDVVLVKSQQLKYVYNVSDEGATWIPLPIRKVYQTYPVSDVLLNYNEGGERRILIPITRYNSILGRPQVITDTNVPVTGAPFHLVKLNETVELPLRTVKKLFGQIT